MKTRILLISIMLFVYSTNEYAQWGARYEPLSPQEIIAPALIMRQRHDAMAKNINDVVMYINNLKSQTNDPVFLTSMDGYLIKLKNMHKTLEERGVNAVSVSSLSQVYNDIQNEIDEYNIRTDYIEAASDAMKNHRYSIAIENLTKIINLAPYNAGNREYYKSRGICYLYGVNKPREAISDFIKYSQFSEPNSIEQAEAFYLTGIGYEMINDFNFSISYYSKCISIDNSFLDAYYRRGIAKSNMNDRKGAIADYDYIIDYFGAAKQAFKNMATVYNNKAYCLMELGDYDTVLSLVNKALELDDNLSYIWDTRGEFFYHKGLYQKCIDDMNKAISIDDELTANSYYYRGLAKIQIGQKTNGCKDLSKAYELKHYKSEDALTKYCK